MRLLMGLLLAVQLLTFPLAWWVWRLDGSPRPFRRWLLVVAFNEEAVSAMERAPSA